MSSMHQTPGIWELHGTAERYAAVLAQRGDAAPHEGMPDRLDLAQEQLVKVFGMLMDDQEDVEATWTLLLAYDALSSCGIVFPEAIQFMWGVVWLVHRLRGSAYETQAEMVGGNIASSWCEEAVRLYDLDCGDLLWFDDVLGTCEQAGTLSEEAGLFFLATNLWQDLGSLLEHVAPSEVLALERTTDDWLFAMVEANYHMARARLHHPVFISTTLGIEEAEMRTKPYLKELRRRCNTASAITTEQVAQMLFVLGMDYSSALISNSIGEQHPHPDEGHQEIDPMDYLDGEMSLKEAIDIWELVPETKRDREWGISVASAHFALGELYRVLRCFEDAATQYTMAADGYAELAQEQPEPYQMLEAEAAHWAAIAYEGSGDPSQAIELSLRALEAWRSVEWTHPAMRLWRQADVLQYLAALYLLKDSYDEAEHAIDRLLGLMDDQKGVIARLPKVSTANGHYLMERATGYAFKSFLLAHRGCAAEASEAFEEALAACDVQSPVQWPLFPVAFAALNFAKPSCLVGAFESAERVCRQVLELTRTKDPESHEARLYRLWLLDDLACALEGQDKLEEAAEVKREHDELEEQLERERREEEEGLRWLDEELLGEEGEDSDDPEGADDGEA